MAAWWGIGQLIAGFLAWGFLPNYSCPDPAIVEDAPTCTKASNQGWRYVWYTAGALVFVMSVARVTVDSPQRNTQIPHQRRQGYRIRRNYSIHSDQVQSPMLTYAGTSHSVRGYQWSRSERLSQSFQMVLWRNHGPSQRPFCYPTHCHLHISNIILVATHWPRIPSLQCIPPGLPLLPRRLLWPDLRLFNMAQLHSRQFLRSLGPRSRRLLWHAICVYTRSTAECASRNGQWDCNWVESGHGYFVGSHCDGGGYLDAGADLYLCHAVCGKRSS